jgi:hypothetical protein
MKRSALFGMAVVAALAMTAAAQAQQNADNYEHGGKPSGQQAAPSAFTSPSTNSPGPYVGPYGMYPAYAPAPYAPAYAPAPYLPPAPPLGPVLQQ